MVKVTHSTQYEQTQLEGARTKDVFLFPCHIAIRWDVCTTDSQRTEHILLLVHLCK